MRRVHREAVLFGVFIGTICSVGREERQYLRPVLDSPNVTRMTYKRPVMGKADSYKWEFKARFRRHAFGWRSQPAITRIKQAVAEITKVAKKTQPSPPKAPLHC